MFTLYWEHGKLYVSGPQGRVPLPLAYRTGSPHDWTINDAEDFCLYLRERQQWLPVPPGCRADAIWL